MRFSLAGSPLIGDRLPAAFDGLVLHHDSRILSEDPLTVESRVPAGAYCAALSRAPRVDERVPEVVDVRLHVCAGAVSVGLLNREETQFLDVDDDLAGPALHDLTILVADMRGAGPLVIRNAGSAPAIFECPRVQNFRLTGAEQLETIVPLSSGLSPIPEWHRYYGPYAATPAEHVRAFQYEQFREPFVMRWHDGLRVLVVPHDESSRALFVSRAYEPASMIALRRMFFAGAVFVDIGAHMGLMTLAASRWVGRTGRVYSIEPSSREIEVLRANLSLNAANNVTVLQAAVHERSGTGTLHIAAGSHRGQNTLAPAFAYEGVELERTESVALVSLDELWKAGRWRPPDVVKIDAEGAELHVLRGATSLLREAAPAIVFEVNETLLRASGGSVAAVEALLVQLRYNLYRVDERTGDLVAIRSLAGERSENFVALPRRTKSWEL